MFKLLAAELSHLPHGVLTKYSAGLVKAGFDCKRALQLASIADFERAGLSKGHAMQLHDVGSSSSSSSNSDSSA